MAARRWPSWKSTLCRRKIIMNGVLPTAGGYVLDARDWQKSTFCISSGPCSTQRRPHADFLRRPRWIHFRRNLRRPLWLPHPVVYMGKVISFLDRSLRKILPKTPRGERIGGAITAFILPVGTFLLSGAVCFFFYKIHWVFGLLFKCLGARSHLPQRDLCRRAATSTRNSKRTTSRRAQGRLPHCRA